LANSEGWNAAGPTEIQRFAPLAARPSTSTASRRPMLVTIRAGASRRSASKSTREKTTIRTSPSNA
jgi:hypothetical protein